ncbi:MAG: TonB-dependent receptor [Sphingopyxis sp.]|nr:TonB-dependent receptor [Sphingopyxis sp.]
MRSLVALIALASSASAYAQTAPAPAPPTPQPVAQAGRVDEIAIRLADDAFGTSIGNEDVGIYNSFDVRGFSPTRAGNIRIEGLYYDQVWALTSRLRRTTTIRVGISALGFPFPAPTGVVDYALRKPGNDARLSAVGSIDSYGASVAEFDAVVPLVNDRLSLGAGVGFYANEFFNGTNSLQHVEGVSLRWTPSPDVEIQPFWSRSDIYDDEVGPIYVPAGSFLPPKVQRRQYLGPQWVEYEGTASLYGATSRFDLSDDWQLRGGLFRSFFSNPTDHFALITDLTPDGRGNYTVLADPPNELASTSGELRLTRKINDGPRLHQLHLSVRARDRQSRYDGTDVIDLGPTRIDDRVDAPEPVRNFGEQARDNVRQQTLGLAYEGRWKGVGELSLGIQKTRYRKRIAQPGLPAVSTAANPWLFNIAAAVTLSDSFAIYGGYTRGLEESGVAPPNATNRNEALPAIMTNQRDIGFRWAITPKVKLIAGLFDVRKPYFNLDASNRFTLLGDVKNQGIEMSLSGALTDRLDIVAGAVLSRPRVTGEGVRLGRLGRLPVDQAARKVDFNVDWRPPMLEGLSLDLSVSHSGPIVATRDNLVSIPERTLVDVGARYAFKLGDNAASIRVSASNLFDAYGFDLQGAGAYDLIDGRRVSARLVVDF